ncbi:MAG: hypothetical protein FWF02_13645 [Micrococcales bacterium]|nr:hypothetical protein [Micrococcales bacterium]MCL2668720.1 hypothetical protein [Micrococcales bacterium]
MSAVLDAGALIAIERRDRAFGAVLLVAQRRGIDLVTSSAVVAQVWRGGRSRGQVNLARQLKGIDERDLTSHDARLVGNLLAASGTSDLADAHIAVIMGTGDIVHTSDPGDLTHLLDTRGIDATVHRV